VPKVVLFYLISGSTPEVEDLLRESGFGEESDGTGSAFVFPNSDNPVIQNLQVSSNGDAVRSVSEEEFELLLEQLGSPPSTCVFAEVPYSHPGTTEVQWLADLLLSKFGGVAIDENLGFDHAWTLPEIRSRARIDGREFFE